MYQYLDGKTETSLIVLNRNSLIQGIGYTGYQKAPEEQRGKLAKQTKKGKGVTCGAQKL